MSGLLAAQRGPMTTDRARALIDELDHLRPAEADHLTPYERATYRRAITATPTLRPRHRAALVLTIGQNR